MKKSKNLPKTTIYQAKNGAIALRGDTRAQTFWATQAQIASIFDVLPQAIIKHLRNIYKEGELERGATCSKMEQVQIEGNRRVVRQIAFYNLDAIIAVGYRVNSKKATGFRIWATNTLRQYILDGYVINRQRIAQNYDAFMAAVDSVRQILPTGSAIDNKDILELVSLFAGTWMSLGAYDKDKLPEAGYTKKRVKLTAKELGGALFALKTELIRQGEATELFGQERTAGTIEGIVGNVMQSFGGADLYPTVEEKAAHLLYFMVKNHPFTDGNKRSGAYAFVWFLRKTRRLNTSTITPVALTALTLLVAQSDPKEKNKITALVASLLVR